jgi:hypothetical protein
VDPVPDPLLQNVSNKTRKAILRVFAKYSEISILFSKTLALFKGWECPLVLRVVLSSNTADVVL